MAGVNSFIFLYGPPASGKSSVGRVLARRLHLPFVDLDETIEQHDGRTIPDIFASDGESYFRELESRMLEIVLTGHPGVVSLGGGALLAEENRAACSTRGEIVCFQLEEDELLRRAAAGKNYRPLLSGSVREKMADLLAQRRSHYASFPNQLDLTGLTAEAAADQICVQLGRFYIANPNRDGGYPIYSGEGVLSDLPQLVESCDVDGRVALVSDSNVAPLYLDGVQAKLEKSGFDVSAFQITAGEGSKSLEYLKTLWDGLLEVGLGRNSMVLALGGGVVSDLAGYAAASFMRGIPWGVVPTSLLAMVDASLGGKTGINLSVGKNLVGAFHAPHFVLADVASLDTLPRREWRSGLAEVVKHGVIADPGLFQLSGQGLDYIRENIAAIVSKAITVKVNVVNIDPFESGLRASLNLGHTIGHAVENLSGYQLSHGAAVSIGMVAEAKIAEMLGVAASGLTAEIASVLVALGLPVDIPAEYDRGAIFDTLKHDKKRAAGKVKFALPVDIGKVKIGVVVDELEKIIQTM